MRISDWSSDVCSSDLARSEPKFSIGVSLMPATIHAAVRAKQIVESLGGRWSGSRGECRCPAHDDHSPSLSVRLGTKAILFKCFAGCTSTDILKALDRQGLHDRETVHVEPRAPSRDLRGLARSLWQHSIPIAGTPPADYLPARGPLKRGV